MVKEDKFLVKLNCKSIDDVRNLMMGSQNRLRDNKSQKYMMCTGKYDKNGWSFIFVSNDTNTLISFNKKFI